METRDESSVLVNEFPSEGLGVSSVWLNVLCGVSWEGCLKAVVLAIWQPLSNESISWDACVEQVLLI